MTYEPIESPVMYAMQILQSQGCNVDLESFVKVNKLVGRGLESSQPATNLLSLAQLCGINGFVIHFNRNGLVVASMPGE